MQYIDFSGDFPKFDPLQSYNQVHKGREQFWSLFLVAANITVTAVFTLAMMEAGGEDPVLRSSTDVASSPLLCSGGNKTGSLRWWFQNLDRYQYIIGNTDQNCLDNE